MRIQDEKYNAIRAELIKMNELTQKQMSMSLDLFKNPDIINARSVIKNEHKLDRFEFKINKDCEKYLVICTPVADDLRRIMEINNILPSIERIGDICEKVAKFIKKYPEKISDELYEQLDIDQLSFELQYMFTSVHDSFVNHSTLKLRDVFTRDKEVNRINKNAKKILIDLIGQTSMSNEKLVNMLLLLTQLERMGDYIKAIAEEIYFGVEGVFMRHQL